MTAAPPTGTCSIWAACRMSGAGLVMIEATGVEARGAASRWAASASIPTPTRPALARVVKSCRRYSQDADRHPARPCRPQGLDRAAVGGRAPARSRATAPGRQSGPRRCRSTKAGTRRTRSPAARSTASCSPSPPRRSAPSASASTRSSCIARMAISWPSSCRPSPTGARTNMAAASRIACASAPRRRGGARGLAGGEADGRAHQLAPTGSRAASRSTRRWCFCRELKARGCDFVCVSSGGDHRQDHACRPGPAICAAGGADQASETEVVTRAVGFIVDRRIRPSRRRRGPGRHGDDWRAACSTIRAGGGMPPRCWAAASPIRRNMPRPRLVLARRQAGPAAGLIVGAVRDVLYPS